MDLNTISSQISKTNSPTGTGLASAMRQQLSDSALGFGQMGTLAAKGSLPGTATSIGARILSGAPRALGGALTLALAALDVANAFKGDLKLGSTDLAQTRGEIFRSSVAVTAGMAAGTVAGGIAAAATALGAPALVIGAIGVGGFLGIGYAASTASDWATSFWSNQQK